ncbi:type II secretion system protein N [Candidatus Electronema sp. PJ]|uniref:type II secretion system protein N n=1 Tax=Candidatus Electronema sp. PJ TaxID=3401572 RepID=UPI003AA96BB9
MIRVAAKLAFITVLAATGVHFGYKYLEKKLLTMSCLPAESPKSSRRSSQAETAAPALPGESAPAAVVQDFEIIVSRDLFKSAADKTAMDKTKEPVLPTQVVPTKLNLMLAGTVAGTEQTARAVIVDNASKNRKQQILQIGDGVQGAVIKAITWNSITLDVNGKLEVLEMPKPKDVPGFGPPAGFNRPPMPEPDISENLPAEEGDVHGRPPVRPNRRINLPQEPEPVEIPDEAALEPPIEEPMPPELPVMEEEPQPMDAE